MEKSDIEKIEIDLLLEAIHKRHGYDFRHYSKTSIKRRLTQRLRLSKFKTFSDMLPGILYDDDFINVLLKDLSITVTEMFRDPPFFETFRKHIVPIIKENSFTKIWHAGCATGEEVYSTAIILEEENLLDQVRLYATDFNNNSLKIAREGIYSPDKIKKYSQNYHASGGENSLSDFYHAIYSSVKINEDLKRNITFANHNLVTDKSFGEMNVILCRNVLIYFDTILQDKIFSLFRDSLCDNGILCLGNSETLEFSDCYKHFSVISKFNKMYIKGPHIRDSKIPALKRYNSVTI